MLTNTYVLGTIEKNTKRRYRLCQDRVEAEAAASAAALAEADLVEAEASAEALAEVTIITITIITDHTLAGGSSDRDIITEAAFSAAFWECFSCLSLCFFS